MLQPFDQRFDRPVIRNLKLDSLESCIGRYREAVQERNFIEHVVQICSQFGHGLISFDRNSYRNCERSARISEPWAPIRKLADQHSFQLEDIGLTLVSFGYGEQSGTKRLRQGRL